MIARYLYGLLFVVVVPMVLVWWAAATATVMPLPTPPWTWPGALVVGAGVLLMASGMRALLVYGRGLPMNAFPPPSYVSRGPYRLVRHPIYIGFALCCVGISIVTRSASGLWLVSPTVALAMTGLVVGFERPDLNARFGAGAIHTPLFSLSPASSQGARLRDRLMMYVLVGIPWVLAFEGVCGLGIPSDALTATLPFEREWTVYEWTTVVYSSTYLLVLVTPFVVKTQEQLRRIALMGLSATAGVTLFYLTVPVISPVRAFVPTSRLGELLQMERLLCHTVAAFPSFHVIWSMIAAYAWSSRSWRWSLAGWTWASLIAVSCVTTGMHAMADVVAAVVAFVLLEQHRRLWEWMRRSAERIGNSWRAWTWNGVRVINYAFYAALAAAVGFWYSSALAGAEAFWHLVTVYIAGLVGAAAWAQKLEGTPRLSRPFGYYGSVMGAAAGLVVATWAGGEGFRLTAEVAMAAPWIQAVGRLRCLVQGCCHGRPASETVGIRYYIPQSRVCALTHLQGVPLHPTPLYSLLANVVLGTILLRLWSVALPFTLIAGVFLILSGIARFVEEALRGEPQTPVVWGLRLYQWTAILSLISGVLLTTVVSERPASLFQSVGSRDLLGGLLLGLLVGAAMGVDFPRSTRRFARLSPG